MTWIYKDNRSSKLIPNKVTQERTICPPCLLQPAAITIFEYLCTNGETIAEPILQHIEICNDFESWAKIKHHDSIDRYHKWYSVIASSVDYDN